MSQSDYFPPARKPKAIHEKLAIELGKAIVSGQIAPGEPLVGEERYSAETGISRTTYREAIRILAAKGLVYSRTKSGTRVNERRLWSMLDLDVIAWMFETHPPGDFIKHFFELRLAVEPFAAQLAALRRSTQDITAMGHALELMRAHGLRSSEGRSADRAFHNAILVATRNEPLMSLSASITAVVGWTTRFSREERGESRDPMPDHEAVFEAIMAQDAVQAEAAMRFLITNATRDAGVIHTN